MCITPTRDLLLRSPDSLTETFPRPPPPQVPVPLYSIHQSQMMLGVHDHSPAEYGCPGQILSTWFSQCSVSAERLCELQAGPGA